MKTKSKCIGFRVFVETKYPTGKSFGERNVDASVLRKLIKEAIGNADWDMDQAAFSDTVKKAKRRREHLLKLKKEWGL